MARIGFMASEEMSFENVDDDDDGRKTGARLYFGSGDLKTSTHTISSIQEKRKLYKPYSYFKYALNHG